MDFKVIHLYERLYKIITTFAVLLVSSSLVFWCYKTQFEASVVFFASIIYALFLFLVGIYINYVGSKINDHIIERADTYTRLESVLSIMKLMEKMPYRVDCIDTFQEITGRSESDIFLRENNGDKTFFAVWGKLKMPLSKESQKKLGKMESKFLDENSKICERIRNTILQSGYANGEIEIIDAISFAIDDWCNSNRNSVSDRKALMAYYNNHNDTPWINADIETLKKSYAKVEKAYLGFKKKAQKNVKDIERAYGKRIDYEAQRLYEISDSISGITQDMDSAKDDIVDAVNEVFDFLQDIEVRLSGQESAVENLADQCANIEKELTSIQETLASSDDGKD